MTYLLDVNALIAFGLQEHEWHDRVARWVKRGRGRGTNCVSHLCRHGIGLPAHPDPSSFLQFYNRARENTAVAAKNGQGIAFHVSSGRSGDRGPSTMGQRTKANHGWPFARPREEAWGQAGNTG